MGFMRLPLVVSLFCLLIWLVSTSAMPRDPKYPHECFAPCNKAYTRISGLNTHQNSCHHALKTLSKGRARRLAQGTSLAVDPGLVARRARLGLSEPLSSSAPAPIVAASLLPTRSDPAPTDSNAEVTPPPEFGRVSPSIPPNSPTNAPFLVSYEGGRTSRIRRRPAPINDILPEAPLPIPRVWLILPEPPRNRLRLIVRDTLRTAANIFGIWREYPDRPSYDPDATVNTDDLNNTPPTLNIDNTPLAGITAPSSQSNSVPTSLEFAPPWPCENMSKFLIMQWANNGIPTKSEEEVDKLVDEVIGSGLLKDSELKGFRANTENKRIDKAADAGTNPLLRSFSETSVNITVPSGASGQPGSLFAVPGLLYRKITDVIRIAFMEPLAHQFHFSPFKSMHRATDGSETRTYGELYTSDAFLQAHDDLQHRTPPPADNPNCTLERVVAALMFFSDATHLTNFGNAKAWPIYLALGNLSKYTRSCPSSGGLHHLAYIPSLPDSFQDFASTIHANWKTQKQDVLTHCRREVIHAVWDFLLRDPEFMHAYHHGMVIKCVDGVERRVYPRLFTYSADYPEKVLLATIRDKGLCPCPRCLVLKSRVDLMGQKRDTASRATNARTYLSEKVNIARHAIYDLGMGIKSAAVELLMKATSSVPTKNAFIHALGDDFDPFKMLVPDFLHEFELGVWKTLFTHLIRVLWAAGRNGNLVEILDERFRSMPTFGRDTIRRFATNTSEMKKLAARNFEDILQCAIPAFEGLLPEPHNGRLLRLLYRLAEWHALAKLRLHTEATLSLFGKATTILGRLFRDFRDTTCAEYETADLPREVAARERAQKRRDQAQQNGQAPSTTPPRKTGQKPRSLNIFTYKFHSLGDYPAYIKFMGTTDSYSTQLGELAHRLVKALYGLTNKKDAMKQIGKKYVRQHALHNMHGGVSSQEQMGVNSARADLHHFISDTQNEPFDLYAFVLGDPDPAKKSFIPKLQDHLLRRLAALPFDGDDEGFSEDERNTLYIVNDRIYKHNILRVNYTTYDVRRDYDTVNPRTHPFLMLKSPDPDPGAHPFWYAQVIGIYHVNVQRCERDGSATRAQRMHFLWVRWLGDEPGWRSGHRHARLPKVGFVPEEDDFAFGFLDPADVIRGSYLMPAFHAGKTSDLLNFTGPTHARPDNIQNDWMNYYVNTFVDRDMAMRYLGGGIGHAFSTSAGDFQVDPDENMDIGDDDEVVVDEQDTESDEEVDEELAREDDEDDDGTGSDDEDTGFDEL